MNHGAVFVHRKERAWLLPTADRALHDAPVFAVKKAKSVRRSQDDISIWPEPSEDFNHP